MESCQDSFFLKIFNFLTNKHVRDGSLQRVLPNLRKQNLVSVSLHWLFMTPSPMILSILLIL